MSTAQFFRRALLELAKDHAVELAENCQIADEFNGKMSMSAKGKVGDGPLAGRMIQITIEVYPEVEND